jgi:hypothetical protein
MSNSSPHSVAIALLVAGAFFMENFSLAAPVSGCLWHERVQLRSSDFGRIRRKPCNEDNQLTMGMGIAAGAIGLRTASLLRGDSTGIPNLMDFHISFGLIAAIALVSVFDFLKLKPGAGSVVSWAQAADEEE